MHFRMEEKSTNFRWFILVLLFIATTILYIDRSALGILAPMELQYKIPGWDKPKYGRIVASFMLAYALCFLIMGRIIDILGTKRGYLLSISIWGMAVIGHALARATNGFALARFILGVGQSGNFPSAVKAVAEWFPKKDRAFVISIFNGGTNVGVILAPLVIPFIVTKFNGDWRAGFLWTIPLSLAWIILWIKYMTKPSENKRVSRLELDYITCDNDLDRTEKANWRDILPHKGAWVIAFAKFMADPVWYFYIFWVPYFYHDINKPEGLIPMSLPIASIYLISWLISILIGWLSSWFFRKGMDINRGRKLGLLVCALLTLPIIYVPFTEDKILHIFLIALAAGGHGGWSANIYSLMSDIFPRNATASVAGLGGFAGALSGGTAALLIGNYLGEKGNEGYTTIFIIISVVYLITLLIMHLILPVFEPIVLKQKYQDARKP